MSEDPRPTPAAEEADACSNNTTLMNSSQQDTEFREVRRRPHNNNNLRQQVDELRHRLQLQEEAIRNIGAAFATLSGLREHGSETKRDRRNNPNHYGNHFGNNSNYSRRGRPGNWADNRHSDSSRPWTGNWPN